MHTPVRYDGVQWNGTNEKIPRDGDGKTLSLYLPTARPFEGHAP